MTVFARKTIQGAASSCVVLDGRPYLNFYGAGYLALSNVPEIRNAVALAVQDGVPFARQWVHASGAIDPAFSAVELAGAQACNTEASVFLASGALIGVAALASVEAQYDTIFYDEGAHFNLTSAIAMSGRQAHAFAHCDANGLADALREKLTPRARPLVVSDGVYPTTGRVPPLQDYRSLLTNLDGTLLLDDAHGFGVVGADGRGAAEHCGVEAITRSGVTLSKAYCAQGALVGCSEERAKNIRAAPLIRGANAGSPLSAIAAAASLRYVAANPSIRGKLAAKVAYCRERLRACGIDTLDSPAPIVSFTYGDRADMLQLQQRLFSEAIVLHYSNYIGAGPHGIIRCAIFSDHTFEDIERLALAVSR